MKLFNRCDTLVYNVDALIDKKIELINVEFKICKNGK